MRASGAGAMDKHPAARPLRTPVVGRTHADGSGSVWSAPLAARMVRVWHTVWLGGLTPPHGLRVCFHAGAAQGGTCPTALRTFLPWQRTPERREARARPVPVLVSPRPDQAHERDAMAVGDTSSDRFDRFDRVA